MGCQFVERMTQAQHAQSAQKVARVLHSFSIESPSLYETGPAQGILLRKLDSHLCFDGSDGSICNKRRRNLDCQSVSQGIALAPALPFRV